MTIAEWLARPLTPEAELRAEWEPFANMTPEERLACWVEMQRAADMFLEIARAARAGDRSAPSA